MQSVIYDCIDELKLAQVYTHSLEFLNVYEGFIQWVVIIQCQLHLRKNFVFIPEIGNVKLKSNFVHIRT